MIINDTVFGELEYNYAWDRDTNIEFLGKEFEIALMISGEENGVFDDGQYEAYKSLMQSWKQIQHDFLGKILEYYIEKRHELGYDISNNENYPLVESVEQLFNMISLVGIHVPYAGIFEGRGIGITFDCTWDEENGIGLFLVNEKIIKVLSRCCNIKLKSSSVKRYTIYDKEN